MVATQMAVLVAQHGQEALAIERHQQGQADGQVVDCTAQQAVARLLANAGVELVIEVHGGCAALDLAADALQGLKQGRRLHGRFRHHRAHRCAATAPAGFHSSVRPLMSTSTNTNLKRPASKGGTAQATMPSASTKQPSTQA
jgi:hypothetical protein